MSYGTPRAADEVENGSEHENDLSPKKTDSPPTSPTTPDDVNPEDGTGEDGLPVENPRG